MKTLGLSETFLDWATDFSNLTTNQAIITWTYTQKHWQYLAFCWGTGNSKRYFVFMVLPFGLATAPFVFTKIQKALLKHWRAQGIRIFAYLGDGVGGHSSLQEAKLVSQVVRDDIDQWFCMAPRKELLGTSSVWRSLGVYCKSCWRIFFEFQREGSQNLMPCYITLGFNNCRVTAHEIARLTGTITSMELAFGPITNDIDYGLGGYTATWCLQRRGAKQSSWMMRPSKRSYFGETVLKNAMGRKSGCPILSLRFCHTRMQAVVVGEVIACV